VTGTALPRAAGFLRRSLAVLADMALFLAAASLLCIPLGRRLAAVRADSPADLVLTVMASPPLLHTALATTAAVAILWWIYFVIGWGLVGATPGKRLFGLAVIDHTGRYPIGPVRAQLRLVAYTLSSLLLCGGHLLVAFRSDHRALHDILSGTRVVRRRDLARRPAPPTDPPPNTREP